MSKLLSNCCQARAKVNALTAGYFCDQCGKDCTTTEVRPGKAEAHAKGKFVKVDEAHSSLVTDPS